MPTSEHELPLEMVRNRPQLIPVLLRTVFGVAVADDVAVTLASESYADVNPAELRCDATVLLGDPDEPDLGVVVESQLRPRREKTFSWPAYLASLRLRRRCPVMLVVLCPDEAVARGCAVPIEMGHPGWVLAPLAVHPGVLPAITDAGRARSLPELAVLSAPVHADGPDGGAVLGSLAAALETLGRDMGALYHDYVLARLSDVARKLLEETMRLKDYQWESDFARTHIAEGRAEGRAEGQVQGEARSVLLFLEARGIPVSDEVRERVTGCADIDRLEHWVRQAAVIDKAEELFD